MHTMKAARHEGQTTQAAAPCCVASFLDPKNRYKKYPIHRSSLRRKDH